ncbi:MAG TPA: hypothetical protein VF637_09815 [Sphingomicrobium sp.]|jgi:hypothetical protein
MKKIALTVAVLGLGLAACQDNAPDNAASTENTVETEAATDVNAAGNDLTASADNALDAAETSVENAGAAIDNAQEAVAENAAH